VSSELSGADLARTALAAAKAQARQNGTGPGTTGKPKKRLGTAKRGSGRDPVGLGAAFAALIAERGWDLDTRAGSITDRWADIVPPELADTIRPEHYDADTQTLHVRPTTPAAATRIRYGTPQLIARVNEVMERQVVLTVKVLTVGPARNPVTGPTLESHRPATGERVMHGPNPCPPNDQLRAARAQTKAAQAQRKAAEEERLNALRFRLGPATAIREPETAFLEGVRAREEADRQAQRAASPHDRTLAASRRRRQDGADTPPLRTLGAA